MITSYETLIINQVKGNVRQKKMMAVRWEKQTKKDRLEKYQRRKINRP